VIVGHPVRSWTGVSAGISAEVALLGVFVG